MRSCGGRFCISVLNISLHHYTLQNVSNIMALVVIGIVSVSMSMSMSEHSPMKCRVMSMSISECSLMKCHPLGLCKGPSQIIVSMSVLEHSPKE